MNLYIGYRLKDPSLGIIDDNIEYQLIQQCHGVISRIKNI